MRKRRINRSVLLCHTQQNGSNGKQAPYLQLVIKWQNGDDPPRPGGPICNRDPSILRLWHSAKALDDFRFVRVRQTVEPAYRLIEYLLMQFGHIVHPLLVDRAITNKLHLGRVVAVLFAARHHPEPPTSDRAQDRPAVLQQ